MTKGRKVASVAVVVLVALAFFTLSNHLLQHESAAFQQGGHAPEGDWWWLPPFIAAWLCVAGCLIWATKQAQTSRREQAGVIAFAVWTILGLFYALLAMLSFIYIPV